MMMSSDHMMWMEFVKRGETVLQGVSFNASYHFVTSEWLVIPRGQALSQAYGEVQTQARCDCTFHGGFVRGECRREGILKWEFEWWQ